MAKNSEFRFNEETRTRKGFGTTISPLGIFGVLAMRYWLKAGVGLLVYTDTNASITFHDLASNADIVSVAFGTIDQADIVDYGPWVIFARSFLGSASQAVIMKGEVADGPSGTGHFAFTPPFNPAVLTFTEPNTGTVTAGLHYFAVVFTTTSGYETRPSPVNGSFPSSGSIADLIPYSFTAAGSKTLQVTFTPTTAIAWYNEYATAALLMTTTVNPSRFFFVPGCTAAVPAGTTNPIVFPEIDLSDVLLAATASNEAITPQRNYFGLYSQDSSFAGPFSPFKTLAYSDRAVYFTKLADGTSALFISEQNAREWVTLAFHLKQLPDRRQIVTGFVLRGSLYILGPNWTYSLSDNNAQPVSWAPAQQVDGRVGTLAVHGVDANSSLGYAWVAHVTGLYLFNQGYYAARPVTYVIQQEWDRINWKAADQLIVKDFPDRKLVFVIAALDGALSTTHEIVIDYTNGVNWDQVNCSEWTIMGASGDQGTSIGAAELVLNPDKNITELWMGLRGAGPFIRSKSEAAGDTDLYSDGEEGGPLGRLGINWIYRGQALPKVFRAVMNYAAVSPRIRGGGDLSNTGTITAVASTLDHKYTQSLAPITVEAAPGEWPLLQMDVQAETLHVELSNGAVPGTFGILAGIKVWWTQLWGQRG